MAGEAGDGAQAQAQAEMLALVATLRRDVVLMDLRMPRMDGVTAIRSPAERGSSVRALVLTTYDTDSDVLPAIRAGATDYLLMESARQDLHDPSAVHLRHVGGQGPGLGGDRNLTPGPALTIRHRQCCSSAVRVRA